MLNYAEGCGKRRREIQKGKQVQCGSAGDKVLPLPQESTQGTSPGPRK